MTISVLHIRAKCIGCNACVEADRGRWRISRKDGKSILIGGHGKKGISRAVIHGEEHALVLKVAATCPARIIKTGIRI
ncbi:MAG: ferredoxin [Bacteroidota bacterium]